MRGSIRRPISRNVTGHHAVTAIVDITPGSALVFAAVLRRSCRPGARERAVQTRELRVIHRCAKPCG